MNWLLIFIIWGRHSETVTQTQFQTKFLCEKAANELNYVNQAPPTEVPVGGFFRCVQVHKVEKMMHILPYYPPAVPTPTPAPQSESQRNHTHKFEVGDCVSTSGFQPFKIYEIMQDGYLNDYGVVLDASCKEEERVLCSGSSSTYNIDYIDREGKLVDCP